jgi:hypothetical protein
LLYAADEIRATARSIDPYRGDWADGHAAARLAQRPGRPLEPQAPSAERGELGARRVRTDECGVRRASLKTSVAPSVSDT